MYWKHYVSIATFFYIPILKLCDICTPFFILLFIHAVTAYHVSENMWEFYYGGILDVPQNTGTVEGEITIYINWN